MTWDSFLDDYEARITSTEEALSNGDAFDPEVLQPFTPPVGLGPFPERLAARAQIILERNVLLIDSLSQSMSEVQSQIAATNHESGAARGYTQGPSMNVPKFADFGA